MLLQLYWLFKKIIEGIPGSIVEDSRQLHIFCDFLFLTQTIEQVNCQKSTCTYYYLKKNRETNLIRGLLINLSLFLNSDFRVVLFLKYLPESNFFSSRLFFNSIIVLLAQICRNKIFRHRPTMEYFLLVSSLQSLESTCCNSQEFFGEKVCTAKI